MKNKIYQSLIKLHTIKFIGLLVLKRDRGIALADLNGDGHINLAYEAYFYLFDQLSPKAIYLMGDDLVTEEHKKCIEVLKTRNVPVYYPEGGIAMGERFHYLRDQRQK